MKTLIINGSPRKNGNTMSLINLLESKLKGDIKIVSTYYADIDPCNDCRYCWTHDRCIIDDDMQNLYHEIMTCDNIIIASSVNFGELTGSLLSALSRLQYFYISKVKKKINLIKKEKKGAVILCGGGDGDLIRAESTAKILLKQMKATNYLGSVIADNTDTVKSIEDKSALEELNKIAEKINRTVYI